MKVNRKDLTVITDCPFCGQAHKIEVNGEDYTAWALEGVYAQVAFPYLSADEREMLISGICPTCWKKTFGEEEEEDDIYICEMESLGENWY